MTSPATGIVDQTTPIPPSRPTLPCPPDVVAGFVSFDVVEAAGFSLDPICRLSLLWLLRLRYRTARKIECAVSIAGLFVVFLRVRFGGLWLCRATPFPHNATPKAERGQSSCSFLLLVLIPALFDIPLPPSPPPPTAHSEPIGSSPSRANTAGSYSPSPSRSTTSGFGAATARYASSYAAPSGYVFVFGVTGLITQAHSAPWVGDFF